jgi:hypothetical protein
VISADIFTQQELRAELNLSWEDDMRTLLVGALIANLVGCSHQPPPTQTAADSCASKNPLACLMSVRVPIRPTSLTTNSATPASKPAIARKAREAAVRAGTAHPRADVKNVGGKSRNSSLMAAQ